MCQIDFYMSYKEKLTAKRGTNFDPAFGNCAKEVCDQHKK
jgi:hypothetical protein